MRRVLRRVFSLASRMVALTAMGSALLGATLPGDACETDHSCCGDQNSPLASVPTEHSTHDASEPSPSPCGHDDHAVSCERHCVAAAILAAGATFAPPRAHATSVAAPRAMTSASLVAEPPPPRA